MQDINKKVKVVSAILEKGKRKVLDYAKIMFRGYERPQHIEYIASKLEGVEMGKIKRLIITCPPRHGKSVLTSRLFPSWYLGRNPDKRVILTSYASTLAKTFSRNNRNDVLSPRYKAMFKVELAKDSKAVNDWGFKGRKGGMISAGVGGAITGHGADLFIIDDPVKNREEAESKVYREKIKNWFTSVARTRLEKDAAIVIILTRWHVDDLAGWLLADNAENWEVVNLKAVAEKDDPLQREKGKALWPDKYDEKALKSIQIAIGCYDWEALYQGSPVPLNAGIIKRNYIRYYDDDPIMKCRAAGIDTATSQKDYADYTSMAEGGRDEEGYIYIEDIFLDRLSVKSFSEYIINRYIIKKFSIIEMEKNNAGEAMRQRIQELAMEKGIPLPLKTFTTNKDKVVRVMEISPLIENGTIKFKRGNPRVEALINNLCMFPNCKHDDDIDAFCFLVSSLYKTLKIVMPDNKNINKLVHVGRMAGKW